MVATMAQRQRRGSRQRAPHAYGGPLLSPGASLGEVANGSLSSTARPASASTSSPRSTSPSTRSAPACSWSSSLEAPATVFEVTRSARGVLVNLEKKRSFVNHYSFHIIDPVFGHVTIKMSGHPPFPAQVILNGHEYVAARRARPGSPIERRETASPGSLTPRAWPRSQTPCPRKEAIGRLGQVCDRWIYSACLCFGLDLDEQAASGFRYDYAVYQLEYSRNLLFASGRGDGGGLRAASSTAAEPAST